MATTVPVCPYLSMQMTLDSKWRTSSESCSKLAVCPGTRWRRLTFWTDDVMADEGVRTFSGLVLLGMPCQLVGFK